MHSLQRLIMSRVVAREEGWTKEPDTGLAEPISPNDPPGWTPLWSKDAVEEWDRSFKFLFSIVFWGGMLIALIIVIIILVSDFAC